MRPNGKVQQFSRSQHRLINRYSAFCPKPIFLKDQNTRFSDYLGGLLKINIMNESLHKIFSLLIVQAYK